MRSALIPLIIIAAACLVWMLSAGAGPRAEDASTAANNQGLPLLTPVPAAEWPAENSDGNDPARCQSVDRLASLLPGEMLRDKEAELERLQNEIRQLRSRTGDLAMFDCELLVVEYALCPAKNAPHEAELLFDAARRSLLEAEGEDKIDLAKMPAPGAAPDSGSSAWGLLRSRVADLEHRRLLRVVAHARVSTTDQSPASLTFGVGLAEVSTGNAEALADRSGHFVWDALPTARGGGRVKLQTNCQLQYFPSLERAEREIMAASGKRLGLGFRTELEIPLGQPLVVGEVRTGQDPASLGQLHPASLQEPSDRSEPSAVNSAANPACQQVAVAVVCVRPVAPSGAAATRAPRGAPSNKPARPEGHDEVIILPANSDAIGPLVPILPRF